MIIPCLRYLDAPAAIAFLCDAFGFTRHLVCEEDGLVVHAELELDGSFIMLGSAQNDNPYGRMMTSPQAQNGLNTQSIYMVVADVDAHCHRAMEKGCEIVSEPEDKDYGGRDYTCRDPEGHVWSFGTYIPQAKA